MVLGEQKKLMFAFGAFTRAQNIISYNVYLFQNRVLLAKCTHLMYKMLMLILNEQQFLISFVVAMWHQLFEIGVRNTKIYIYRNSSKAKIY